MGLERRGTQFRLRVASPKKFQKKSFITLDVGRKGGLQLVRAVRKGRKNIQKNLETQSFRVSVKDFKRVKNKLIPTTARGRRQRTSLLRRKKKPQSMVKIYL